MNNNANKVPMILMEDSGRSGWGPRDNWDFDGRGADGNPTDYHVKKVLCVRDDLPVTLKHQINEQTDGVIYYEFTCNIENGEGFYIKFYNDKDVFFKIVQKKDGFYMDEKKIFDITYGFHFMRFIIDIDNAVFEVITDNKYMGKFFANGSARSISELAYGYDIGNKGLVSLNYNTTMYKNYHVYDSTSIFAEQNWLPYPYKVQTTGKASAKIANTGGDLPFCYSYTLTAKKDSSVKIERYFDKSSTNVSFQAKYILWDRNGKIKLGLYHNDTPCIEVSDLGEELVAKAGKMRKHHFLVWQAFRTEVNFIDKTAIIYLNGKKITVVNLDTVDLESVNNIKFELVPTSDKATKASIGEIYVFPKLPEPEDYVPEPIIPKKKGEYYIGMNNCPIWRPGNHFGGWDNISGFEEVHPVLGFYDEGSTELADWEIKFWAEHGVDFQLYCWYPYAKDCPMRSTGGGMALSNGHMFAKYSDKVKFALLWESAGTRPLDSKAFRKYYVPYLIDHYFSDDRYMRIDNKAVMSMFAPAALLSSFGTPENVKTELDYLRKELIKIGYDGLIMLFCSTGVDKTMKECGFDGAHAYSFGRIGYDPEMTKKLNKKAFDLGIHHYVPTVSSGYNLVQWKGTRSPLMKPSDMTDTLTWIKDEILPKHNKDTWESKLVVMSTWNEYGEGTYISPTKLHGFGYLDAIRKAFCEDVPHVDVVPTENQKKRINRMTVQSRFKLARLDMCQPDLSKTKPIIDIKFESEKDLEKWEFYGYSKVEIKNGKLHCVSESNNPYMLYKFDEPVDADKISYALANVLSYKSGKQMCATRLLATTNPNMTDGFFEIEGVLTNPDKAIDMKFRFYGKDGIKGKYTAIKFCPIWSVGEFEIKNFTLFDAPEHPSVYINDELTTFSVYPEYDDGECYFCFDPKSAFAKAKELYYEWDNKNKELNMFGKVDAKFKLGSDIAIVDGKEVKLKKIVEMYDGLPVIPLSVYCKIVGYDCKITKNIVKVNS